MYAASNHSRQTDVPLQTGVRSNSGGNRLLQAPHHEVFEQEGDLLIHLEIVQLQVGPVTQASFLLGYE